MSAGSRGSGNTDFRVIVRWNGREVAGFSEVQDLGDSPAPFVGDERSDAVAVTVAVKPSRITFKRGVIEDPDFQDWARRIVGYGPGEAAEETLRATLIEVDLIDEEGHMASRVRLHDCHVTSVVAAAPADGERYAIERLVVDCLGMQAVDAQTDGSPA